MPGCDFSGQRVHGLRFSVFIPGSLKIISFRFSKGGQFFGDAL